MLVYAIQQCKSKLCVCVCVCVHVRAHMYLKNGTATHSSFLAWRIPWMCVCVCVCVCRREQQPTPGFWPGEFYGLYSPWGRKESDTNEWLSHIYTHTYISSPSCLAWRTPWTSGAWQATVHGIAELDRTKRLTLLESSTLPLNLPNTPNYHINFDFPACARSFSQRWQRWKGFSSLPATGNEGAHCLQGILKQ